MDFRLKVKVLFVIWATIKQTKWKNFTICIKFQWPSWLTFEKPAKIVWVFTELLQNITSLKTSLNIFAKLKHHRWYLYSYKRLNLVRMLKITRQIGLKLPKIIRINLLVEVSRVQVKKMDFHEGLAIILSKGHLKTCQNHYLQRPW